MIKSLSNKYCFLFVLLASLVSTQAKAKKDFMFGPTGIHGHHSQRDITVTRVAKGSPADGIIKPKMKIVGVNDKKFGRHLRKQLAEAIDLAETVAGKGQLKLMISNGKSVTLKLQVLGSYSSTAPYNCKKSEAILNNAQKVQFIDIKSGKSKNTRLGRMYFDLLCQLALDGKTAAKKFANYKWESTDENSMFVTWSWGYRIIAMGEYYFLTGDKKVLPHIKTYAVALAKGQDAGGIWGHQLATPERNGRLPGYAQMNQPSLTCFIALLYAQKCGIKDPELTKGIDRANTYFSNFIGRGTFPYGVHPPNRKELNNNGMSATAAIAMNLSGNKQGASFFTHLAAASYNEIENGHGSHFFNCMWTPIGASLAGPEVLARFFKETRWLIFVLLYMVCYIFHRWS